MGLYIGDGLGTFSQQIGEERELVLFFLDVRNFTPFVESHLAFDIIHIVRKLFSVFQHIIETNNGKIIETAGDGLYAVFGCETSPKQSVPSSVQAALLILQDIETLNDTYFKLHFNENIQIGIGVHIGRVISGVIQIGSEERMIVMGYPVNIASRLQNATKSLNNSFVISSEVYNLLLKPPKARTALITLKGVSNKLTVYLLGKPYN
jgi:adenylate cyclase